MKENLLCCAACRSNGGARSANAIVKMTYEAKELDQLQRKAQVEGQTQPNWVY